MLPLPMFRQCCSLPMLMSLPILMLPLLMPGRFGRLPPTSGRLSPIPPSPGRLPPMPGRLPPIPGRSDVARQCRRTIQVSDRLPGRSPMLPGNVVGRFTFPRLGRSPPPDDCRYCRVMSSDGSGFRGSADRRRLRDDCRYCRVMSLDGSSFQDSADRHHRPDDCRCFPAGSLAGFRSPRFGRLPLAIPPLGNEGRLTGFTLLGGRTDGRFATAEPPGRVAGRATFGRPPPDGLKPRRRPRREALPGREALPIEGRLVLGREGAGRDTEGRLP